MHAPPKFTAILLSALLVPLSAFAQAPAITAVAPQAIPPGEATTVVVRGQNLAGAKTLWTSFDAEAVLDPEVKDNGTDAGVVTFRVTVPESVAVGVHGIRVVTDHGVSPIRLFVVDDLPTVAGEGGHDSVSAAQEIAVPCAVDGNVDALKRKFFRFRAEAGQRLSFEVLSRRTGSPLDPVIRLLDDAGREIAYSDDELALSGDARLRHEFAEAGEYLLAIRDIRYQGGGGHRFRLRIGDFPCLDVPVPMAAQRGGRVTLDFAGPHAEGVAPVMIDVPEDPSLDWLNVSTKFESGGASGFIRIAVVDAPQIVESEPNDAREQATRAEPGAGLNGRLEKLRDVDHFVFAGTKGRKLRFSAVTRRQGSAADLYLRLLDANGKQLAVAEDDGANDGEINFTVPADGDYVLAIEDLHHRGGPRFAYRIDVGEPDVGFSLAAAADRIQVPAGGVGALTVNVNRGAHKGPVELVAEGLPEGVTSAPIVVGPGLNLGVVTLQGADSLAPGTTWQPRIVGRATIGGNEVTEVASIANAVKAGNANVPYPPPTLDESLMAAAIPATPFSLQVASHEVVFGRSLSGKLAITAKRSEGYDGEIALALVPEKDGLPGNVTAALKPIPAGANEVEVAFNATDKAALGRFAAAIRGTLKKDEETVTRFAPAIELRLEKPFALDVEPKTVTLKPGDKATLTVKASRNPALAAVIELALENLPAGVTAETAPLAADADSVPITLTAADDAQPAEAKNVVVVGTATAGETKLTEKSAAFTVTVPQAEN